MNNYDDYLVFLKEQNQAFHHNERVKEAVSAARELERFTSEHSDLFRFFPNLDAEMAKSVRTLPPAKDGIVSVYQTFVEIKPVQELKKVLKDILDRDRQKVQHFEIGKTVSGWIERVSMTNWTTVLSQAREYNQAILVYLNTLLPKIEEIRKINGTDVAHFKINEKINLWSGLDKVHFIKSAVSDIDTMIQAIGAYRNTLLPAFAELDDVLYKKRYFPQASVKADSLNKAQLLNNQISQALTKEAIEDLAKQAGFLAHAIAMDITVRTKANQKNTFRGALITAACLFILLNLHVVVGIVLGFVKLVVVVAVIIGIFAFIGSN